MLESSFNRLAGFNTCNVLKKSLQQRCFPINIAKFLRTLILMKICEQLLLQLLLLIVNNFSSGLFSALISIELLQRSSSRFKEFSLGYLVVGSSLIWKKEKLAKMATRCHSLYHSLSFAVPLVVTRCHSLYHSLLFVVTRCTTRCHSLSLNVPLVCLFINNHNFRMTCISFSIDIFIDHECSKEKL